MSTFAQMRAIIADDLDRSDMTTQINRAINRAIEHYESEPFWFKETTGTFSTAASTKAYTTATIPSDIAEIDYAEVVVNSSDYEVKETTYQEIERMDVTHAVGIPSKYAFYKNSIYLYPIPNNIYTVRLSYTKTYSTLSADSDTNDWTTDAEDLIEARACWWIYSRVLKDMEQAASYKNLELDALRALRDKTIQLVGTDSPIVGTQF